MYPLFESICVLDGVIQNKEWHELRYERSYLSLYGQAPQKPLLEEVLIPEAHQKGTHKLRIAYNESDKQVVLTEYHLKPIQTLKVVVDDTIDYHVKYEDRSRLKDLFSQREHCDDVLIVKNGFVTDSSYSNIVFFDGSRWVTPSTPLLCGTTRERLLSEQVIEQKDIHVNDIDQYLSFKLINAMRDFDRVATEPVSNISLP